MRARTWMVVTTLFFGLGPLSGCLTINANGELPLSLDELNDIRNDDNIEPAEKRRRLEALGIEPAVVNGLLDSVRLANQFGGDLQSAFDKVKAGQLDQLTPDEIQYYGDEASDVSADVSVNISDAQAQAIADVFDRNNIQTSDDLQAFLDDPTSEVPTSIPSGVLEDLFINFDPDLLIPSLP